MEIGTYVKVKNCDRVGIVLDFMACHDGNRYKVKLLGIDSTIEADESFFEATHIQVDNNYQVQ